MRNRFTTMTAILIILLFPLLTSRGYAQGDKDKFKARYENAVGSKEFDQLANLGVIRPNRVRAAVGFKL